MNNSNRGSSDANARAHIRQVVELPARISAGNFQGKHCTIRDFCLGGMLVLLPETEQVLLRSLQRDDLLRLDVEVNGFRGTRTATVSARLVRRDENALGLSFVAPDVTDLLAIQNHVRSLVESQPAAVLEQKPTQLSKQRRMGISQELQAVAESFFREKLATFFEKTQARFLIAMEKVHSNEQQLLWVENEKLLKRQAPLIERSYLAIMRQPLEHLMTGNIAFLQEENAAEQSGNNRLALVDKESFEDWLVLKVMSSKAENRFNEQIIELQLRLGEVYNHRFTIRQNPFHPLRICSALGDSLRGVAFKARADRDIHAAFEEAVVLSLSELYEQLNKTLISLGILPELDVARYLSSQLAKQPGSVKPPVAEPVVAQVPSAPTQQQEKVSGPAKQPSQIFDAPAPDCIESQPPAHDGQPAAESVSRARPGAGYQMSLAARQFALQQHIAQNAYETARRLLSTGHLAAVTDKLPDTPEAAPLKRELVEQHLQQLQAQGEASKAGPLGQRVTDTLQSTVDAESLQLDAELQAGITIIEGLFDGILGNKVLTERARKAIKQLEIPFLRLLMQDDTFLLEEKHPARQVLNKMARLGVRGTANLIQHEAAIEQQAGQICAKFDKAQDVFNESLATLEQLTEQQNRLYLRNMKRVAEASEGRNRILRARERVAELLEDMVGGREVPRAVLTLIDAGWKPLLVQTLLRHGAESSEWAAFSSVLNKLIEARETVPSATQLTQLLAIIKQGLALVDETQMQNPQLMEDLRLLLSARHRTSDKLPTMVTLPEGVASADLVQPLEIAECSDQRWVRRAQGYQVGDWFDYHDVDGVQKIHLAWVDDNQQTFVFVNPQGMQVIEYRLDIFARELENGKICPADNEDLPAVDRGLEAMVCQVYSQTARHVTHDELSGLINRREFERRLRLAFEKPTTKVHLIHLDIDQFKVVNHLGGPQAGDSLIKQFASLLLHTFNDALVARLGGDEFALVLHEATPEAVLRRAEQFARQLVDERFLCAGKSFSITVSAGLASRDSIMVTAEELIRSADATCQLAKEAGRNRIQRFVYDDKDLIRRDTVMSWVTRLNDALDSDQLLLRCQRIESTVQGKGRPSYEILLSIADENGEVLTPAEFMHAAEQYNRVHAIDRWVVKNVLRWMQENPAVLETLDHLSINLSGHSMNDTSLLEFLFEQFQQSKAPLHKLCFEVTETAAIANLEDAADFIQELKSLGCRFSLDDFGSGLASYGHLKQLPVDYIKIDGSFIKDLGQDAADVALVRSINELGHLMGKQTIAEYVENDNIRRLVQEIGVDYVQGYGVEHPRPLSTLQAV